MSPHFHDGLRQPPGRVMVGLAQGGGPKKRALERRATAMNAFLSRGLVYKCKFSFAMWPSPCTLLLPVISLISVPCKSGLLAQRLLL